MFFRITIHLVRRRRHNVGMLKWWNKGSNVHSIIWACSPIYAYAPFSTPFFFFQRNISQKEDHIKAFHMTFWLAGSSEIIFADRWLNIASVYQNSLYQLQPYTLVLYLNAVAALIM